MTTLAILSPDTTMRTAALSYAARGWAVLPLFSIIDGSCGCGTPGCATPGKHPHRALAHNGLHNASKFAAHVERWWSQAPDCNIAIRTGQASGLIVIDLDDRPHDGRDGAATWRRLIAEHANGVHPDTVEALTGGGGRHVYFRAPDDVLIATTKDALGAGVEVKAEGGYVVAPPSRHASGRDYAWELSSHPDDTPVAPMPPWLLSLCRTRAPRADVTVARLPATMSPLEVVELRSALACLSSDDRDDWVAMGMALHSTGDDDHGFALWDAWSQTSVKYDAVDMPRVWRSFSDRADGLTIASIYKRAHTAGWQRPSLERLATDAGVVLPVIAWESFRPPVPVPVRQTPAAVATLSDPLSTALPGHLESIVQWSLATAPHPVRGYAIAAAMALGSVCCARRYVTDAGNYASLYLLVVGKSGTGKEHVRHTIESVLHAAAVPQLVGPNRWTSDSAVFSGLLQAPQQLAVLDEFGQFLGGATGAGENASMKDGVLTQLMELYGRLHGRAQSPQYATLTMSGKQADAAKRKTVDRPALTLVGLTTPAMWYGALRSSRIASGFLNRFCVLETDVPRGDYAIPSLDPVPSTVVDWVQQLLAPSGDLDLLTRCSEIGEPQRLVTSTDAQHAFTAFRRDCNRLADALEAELLGELPMRAAEQAMRLAMVACLAEDPTHRLVRAHHAAWGIDTARTMLHQLVPTVRERMADSPLAALRKRFVARLREAGEHGLTDRDMRRESMFYAIQRRDRDEVVSWAVELGIAEWGIRTHGGAGRPTRVLRILANTDTQGAA